jgi:poly-gamma-glutamate capsule biosynthesis protein CapA/YwtB (metallophosphatase superfamily)
MVMVILLGACQPQAPMLGLQPGRDQPIDPLIPIQRVTFTFTGDLLFETANYADAQGDFSTYFAQIKPDLVGDFVVGNQEVVIGGEALGVSGDPFVFNAPAGLAQELATAGFNVLTLSNNHVFDKGLPGITNTLTNLKDVGILPIGLFDTPEDAQSIPILEKNGIRIALLTYTYAINRRPPENLRFITRVYLNAQRKFDAEREAQLRRDIQAAKAVSDAIIVAIHWGNEFTYTLSESQLAAARVMNEEGVDLIIGNHPHTPQTAQVLVNASGHRTIVFYSLGNLVSGETDIYRTNDFFNVMFQTGILVQATFIKHTNVDHILIDDVRIIPIVNHFEHGRRHFRLIPLEEYTEELAEVHAQRVTIPFFTKSFITQQMQSLYAEFLDSINP